MSTNSFFDPEAKTTVKKAVERAEERTSAEIVVAVRRETGQYRDADLYVGAVVGLACLALVLFSDREFSTRLIPFDVAAAFAVGAIFSANAPPLRRLLVSAQRREDNAHRAACAAFQALKIGRTSARNGVLVLVAMFERKVAIVCDVGIDPASVGAPFEEAVAKLRAAVEQPSPDLGAFASGIEALGAALGTVMPRGDDDVNELPDDMGVE